MDVCSELSEVLNKTSMMYVVVMIKSNRNGYRVLTRANRIYSISHNEFTHVYFKPEIKYP